jgi:chlorite dismutase
MSDTAAGRQFVSFTAFKLDPAFRRLDSDGKRAAAEEFAAAVEAKPEAGEFIGLSYSTSGLKADADFLLWRIAFDPAAIQQHTARLNKTTLGGYLTVTHSLLSMTKRSQYIDPVDPFHDAESRTRIFPGRRKYLFVYPFVKTRPWYLLSLEKRQELMSGHIRIGNEYPSVKLNTTYSFGLDDQDFVVAFETDEPKDFLDLVQHLRETESSLYTQRDTPMFTCVRRSMAEILDELF